MSRLGRSHCDDGHCRPECGHGSRASFSCGASESSGPFLSLQMFDPQGLVSPPSSRPEVPGTVIWRVESLGATRTWVWSLALSPPSCVTLSKSPTSPGLLSLGWRLCREEELGKMRSATAGGMGGPPHTQPQCSPEAVCDESHFPHPEVMNKEACMRVAQAPAPLYRF